MFVARFLVPCLPMALLLATGCGGPDDGRMQVYPVSGQVLVDGQPAEGAEVVLYGATPELQGRGTVAPSAETDANGEFTLRSYDPGDGAPAGEFKVTIVWPAPPPQGADSEFYEPVDRLGGAYATPDATPLTVTIEKGSNSLPPFELNN